MGRSMKAQMREADKLKARFVLILGADEIAQGEVTLKIMQTGEQKGVKMANIAKELSLP
jgi:histidyl-tRNA synthetase